MPPEIPSRRLALEPLVDHVGVALDRGKVSACFTDLARCERMFGIVGHCYSMSALVSIRLVLHVSANEGRGSAAGVASLLSEQRPQ